MRSARSYFVRSLSDGMTAIALVTSVSTAVAWALAAGTRLAKDSHLLREQLLPLDRLRLIRQRVRRERELAADVEGLQVPANVAADRFLDRLGDRARRLIGT